ncbi:MAG: FAD-dependent monooxygenase [Candidatus Melainabacteria bacterium]|nr:FAD-dependent monooxygenase [Candidatus Melainabacteria bacterium]
MFTRTWDCVVIGAGPAGAMAAREVASAGHTVLLVDKSSFPRYKVCGCCVNGSAQEALAEAGLSHILQNNNAVSLEKLLLFDGNRAASIQLPLGASISRSRFDEALIEAAVTSGATFLQNTNARVLNKPDRSTKTQNTNSREVSLDSADSKPVVVESAIVIVADGLSGKSLDGNADFKPALAKDSRFGAGVILDDGSDYYERGRIHMACGPGGYVGLVRLEDNRLDVAAAFDQAFSRESHGPGKGAAKLLQDCGLPVPSQLQDAQWTGTQLLTRRRERIGAERLLVTGDACGYPEPFTGEGIAWALWSGLLGGRLAVRGIQSWHPKLLREWFETNQRFRRQQSRSRLIAIGLRNNAIRHFMLDTLSRYPGLASPVVQVINQAQFKLQAKPRVEASR